MRQIFLYSRKFFINDWFIVEVLYPIIGIQNEFPLIFSVWNIEKCFLIRPY